MFSPELKPFDAALRLEYNPADAEYQRGLIINEARRATFTQEWNSMFPPDIYAKRRDEALLLNTAVGEQPKATANQIKFKDALVMAYTDYRVNEGFPDGIAVAAAFTDAVMERIRQRVDSNREVVSRQGSRKIQREVIQLAENPAMSMSIRSKKAEYNTGLYCREWARNAFVKGREKGLPKLIALTWALVQLSDRCMRKNPCDREFPNIFVLNNVDEPNLVNRAVQSIDRITESNPYGRIDPHTGKLVPLKYSSIKESFSLDEIKTWIEEYKTWARTNNFNDNEALRYLPYYLLLSYSTLPLFKALQERLSYGAQLSYWTLAVGFESLGSFLVNKIPEQKWIAMMENILSNISLPTLEFRKQFANEFGISMAVIILPVILNAINITLCGDDSLPDAVAEGYKGSGDESCSFWSNTCS
jgi:hypothetical protein